MTSLNIKRGGKKLLLNLSNNNNTNNSSLLDNLSSIKERLVTDPTQPWHESEILYYIEVQKKGGIFTLQKQQSDKYLFVLKPNEQGRVYILIVTIIGRDFAVKYNWDMKLLRGIDSGDSENDIILSFDNIDYQWIFSNSMERDETIWVLVSLAKKLCNIDIYAGSPTHFNSLGYVAVSHGITSRFPLLEKYIVSHDDLKQLNILNNGINTNINEEEEAEAELLLEELQWNVDTASPDEFRKHMSTQADELHKEIINFLLQWEGDDNININNKDNNNKDNNNKDNENNMKRITMQVIAALGQVGEQLFSVDEWLTEQIKKLEEIEKRLVVIKSESTQLETSWSNISKLKNIISVVVENLTLSSTYELVLMKPQNVIESILKDNELKDPGNQLIQLYNAIKQLRNGLNFDPVKLTLGNKTEITLQQWKELQTVTAISSQRNKLMETADTFTEKISDLFTKESKICIFDSILKHKYLNEDKNSSHCIIVTQFHLSNLLLNSLIMCSPSAQFRIDNDEIDYSVWYTRHIIEGNQLLHAQEVYHIVINRFVPLTINFLEISPSSASLIFNSYSNSTHDNFYKNLFDKLFDLIKIEYSYKNIATNFNNTSKALLNEKNEVPIKLRLLNKKSNNSSDTKYPPWIGLEMLLQIIAPVINKEIEFCTQLFQTELIGKDKDGILKILKSILDIMFGDFITKFNKYITIGSGEVSNGKSDGCEIIAMLSIIEWFIAPEKYFIPNSNTNNLLDDDDNLELINNNNNNNNVTTTNEHNSINNNKSLELILEQYSCSDYLLIILNNARDILKGRLKKFIDEQIQWLDEQQKISIGKKTGILEPFEKFPTLVDQIQEMTGTLELDYIADMYDKLCDALITWLTNVAKADVKHADIILIHNLGFFVESMGIRGIRIINKYVSICALKRVEAETRYINWMISYECPGMSNLYDRINSINGRVKKEEFRLYVLKEEVLTVFKTLNPKKLKLNIIEMKKRLEKHCGSPEAHELNLVTNIWSSISTRLIKIFTQLEEVGQASYQIESELTVDVVKKILNDPS